MIGTGGKCPGSGRRDELPFSVKQVVLSRMFLEMTTPRIEVVHRLRLVVFALTRGRGMRRLLFVRLLRAALSLGDEDDRRE
jgi:hypothetical protein